MSQSQKTALLTGVTGQDGSYLAELLLHNGYQVIGLVRPGGLAAATRSENLAMARSFGSGLNIVEGDLLDRTALASVLRKASPNEIYHLAAPSHVGESFADPKKYSEWIEQAAVAVLQAIVDACPEAKFFHASSAEVFGEAKESPQDEATPLSPASPYGAGKAAATSRVRKARERYGVYACNGILYNHESPRRGPDFVTQKIANGVAAIAADKADQLRLGYLESRRDWGHAKDFVRAMWMMLQGAASDDYVIATGETHSVREFVAEAFAVVGLDSKKHVISDPSLRRAVDPQLVGNPEKIRSELGWKPEYTFKQIVAEMVQAAMERAGA